MSQEERTFTYGGRTLAEVKAMNIALRSSAVFDLPAFVNSVRDRWYNTTYSDALMFWVYHTTRDDGKTLCLAAKDTSVTDDGHGATSVYVFDELTPDQYAELERIDRECRKT